MDLHFFPGDISYRILHIHLDTLEHYVRCDHTKSPMHTMPEQQCIYVYAYSVYGTYMLYAIYHSANNSHDSLQLAEAVDWGRLGV